MRPVSTSAAMVLITAGQPLQRIERPIPAPGPDDVLLRVSACGVCRTDLHVVDGELPPTRLPLVPGHEIVGTVVERGNRVRRFATGDRVGVPWLGGTCGAGPYCRSNRENLCDTPEFTGSLYVDCRVPAVSGLSLRCAGVFHVGERAINAQNTAFVDGYTTFDIGGRYDTEFSGKPTTLRLYVENVTDEAYWSATGSNPASGFPLRPNE